MSEGPPADGARTSRVVLRYAAFQLPGFAAMLLGATVAHEWFEVPAWIAACAVLLWMLKDAVMFPFVRRAYEPGDGRTPRDVNGALGVADETLDPNGYVRIGSELWRARGPTGASIGKGQTVRVTGVRGLTVSVEPEEPGDR